jgi:hypothetical protein
MSTGFGTIKSEAHQNGTSSSAHWPWQYLNTFLIDLSLKLLPVVQRGYSCKFPEPFHECAVVVKTTFIGDI